MKYFLSLIIAFLVLAQAQPSARPALTSTLLFNGAGTTVVSSFQTNSAFVANISSSASANLSLFDAKTGQKIMNFRPGEIMPYTGEFFFIVYSPKRDSSWQIDISNQSYVDSINQARQEQALAASHNSSIQNNVNQALSNALSFEGTGNNSTTEFLANSPFVVNFNQDSGIRLFLYSGTNNIASIVPGQTLNYTGQFYIYVNSPAEQTAWRIDLNNVN